MPAFRFLQFLPVLHQASSIRLPCPSERLFHSSNPSCLASCGRILGACVLLLWRLVDRHSCPSPPVHHPYRSKASSQIKFNIDPYKGNKTDGSTNGWPILGSFRST
ncbi:hypothetical protein BJV82DRAFT_637521 [Fennellomyces sp. T-0311]|nr:hypothetical protein BJV82DRAFT_637521 [Fennellomyces sp. T-0311]